MYIQRKILNCLKVFNKKIKYSLALKFNWAKLFCTWCQFDKRYWIFFGSKWFRAYFSIILSLSHGRSELSGIYRVTWNWRESILTYDKIVFPERENFNYQSKSHRSLFKSMFFMWNYHYPITYKRIKNINQKKLLFWIFIM